MADDSRYTEGVASDGVVILDDGRPVPISLILTRLNRAEDTAALSVMLANSNTVCRDLGFDEIDKISRAVVAYLHRGEPKN